MRRPWPPPPPPVPREERARRALERGLALAALAVVAAGWVEGAASRSTPPPLGSLPVDLANDPPWRLCLLPGVGPARAEALVRDRAAHGPVRSLADLDRVPGFGPRTIAALASAGAFVGPSPPEGPSEARLPRDAPADGAGREAAR